MYKKNKRHETEHGICSESDVYATQHLKNSIGKSLVHIGICLRKICETLMSAQKEFLWQSYCYPITC